MSNDWSIKSFRDNINWLHLVIKDSFIKAIFTQ